MKIIITFLFLSFSAIYGFEVKSLQNSLKKYDPIISEDKTIIGTLHFPEVQSVLPDFYKQLFERVQIELVASKQDVKIQLKGKNEFLKDMVRQQFLKIENQLKNTIRQAFMKDPLYRLNKIIEKPKNYTSNTQKYNNNTSYTFVNKIKEATEEDGPSKLSFDLSEDGKLKNLTIVDWKYTTEITFESFMKNARYYFSELKLIQTRNGIPKYRTIKINYHQVGDDFIPREISLAETDQRGELTKVSGNLNPISVHFKKK
jgi:hypothetical protein